MGGMQGAVRQTEMAIQRMASQDMTFALESKSHVQEIISTMEGQNRSRLEAIGKLATSAHGMEQQRRPEQGQHSIEYAGGHLQREADPHRAALAAQPGLKGLPIRHSSPWRVI